jgi:hypothetical protein
MNSPFSFVIAVRSLTLMWTPGMTAPDVSLTVPLIVPTLDWAVTMTNVTNADSNTTAESFKALRIRPPD